MPLDKGNNVDLIAEKNRNSKLYKTNILADTERTRKGRHGPKRRLSELTPDHIIRLKRIDAVDANVRLLIRYGLLALVAFFGYRSIYILAGRYTFADIGVRFLADIRIVNSIGYVVGAGGVLYGCPPEETQRRYDSKNGNAH